MFWDKEHANSRLSGCVVRTKRGKPVYILEVFAEDEDSEEIVWAAICQFSPDKAAKSLIKVSDLDLSPVPLGYVNSLFGAAYAYRLPKRMWKIGLTNENFLTVSYQYGVNGCDVWSDDVVNTIYGLYPSIQEAVDRLSAGPLPSIAFARNFALTSSLLLLYNGETKVGVYNKDSKEMVLNQDFFYLKEMLQEAQE